MVSDNALHRVTSVGYRGSAPPVELSALDRAIIDALQQDARQPFGVLANRVGTSEPSARRRVKALIDADVIAVTAVADPRVFGLNSLAWIAVATEAARIESVAGALVELPAIDYAVVTTGEYAVMAEAACTTVDALYELVLAVRRVPGVLRTETFPYLKLLRQSFDWNRAGDAVGGVQPVPGSALQSVDVPIIRALQRNGRASFRELGAVLGVSERVVSARYTELTAIGAMRVSAVVNPLNVGWSTLAWLGIRLTPAADLEAVARGLGAVPAVSYLVVASGRYDLMAEVVCRTHDDLLRTVSEAIGGVDGVGPVDVFSYLRLLYRTTAGAWSGARSLAGGVGPR